MERWKTDVAATFSAFQWHISDLSGDSCLGKEEREEESVLLIRWILCQIEFAAFQLTWRSLSTVGRLCNGEEGAVALQALDNIEDKIANVPEIFFSEWWKIRLLAGRQQSRGQLPEVLTDVGVTAATLWRLSCLTPAASEEMSSLGRRHVVVRNSALELSKYVLVTAYFSFQPKYIFTCCPKATEDWKTHLAVENRVKAVVNVWLGVPF